MYHAVKDTLTSQAAKTWANNLIVRYGKVQDLKIDSRRKTVEVSCLLHGEPAPVSLRIEDYVVEREAGRTFVRGGHFHCSRPWLQNFLADFGPRQRIELPAWAAAML